MGGMSYGISEEALLVVSWDIEVNGKALDRERGPAQLVVNGKGSNWWIKQVAKITVIK